MTIRSDSMTVVLYINRQGGTQSVSLCKEVIRVLVWCSHREISLVAVHLPGQDNTIADALSRPYRLASSGSTVRGSSVDWCLDP